jgi:hypothetical protein
MKIDKNYKVAITKKEHVKEILIILKKLNFSSTSKKASQYLYVHTDKTYEFVDDKDLFAWASLSLISSTQFLQKIK